MTLIVTFKFKSRSQGPLDRRSAAGRTWDMLCYSSQIRLQMAAHTLDRFNVVILLHFQGQWQVRESTLPNTTSCLFGIGVKL